MKIGNIIKSPYKFVKDRFFKDYNEVVELNKEEGKIVEQEGKKIAIYKDREGTTHQLSAICTHLGCVIEWNSEKKRWDCPCHGASYSPKGKVTSGPARKDLPKVKDIKIREHLVKILEIEKITHDVKRFKVTKPEGYQFTPGQATEVAVNKDGFREKFRPFTFTSLNEDNYLEFIIKEYPVEKYPEHTGVTEKIHTLKPGDNFIIKDPVGTIQYEGKGVFIAGGAGITPFIAIFRDLKKRNKLKGNTLIFSNKEERDVIIEKELKEMFDDNNLILTLTREKVEGYEYGRIDKETIEKHIDDFEQYFYICGPSELENDITKYLKELNVKEKYIIIEEW